MDLKLKNFIYLGNSKEWSMLKSLLIALLFLSFILTSYKSQAQDAGASSNTKMAGEDDWTKQANFLSSKEGKVKEFRLKIESLIKQKKIVNSDVTAKKIVKEMIETHNEFTKATLDYNKVYNKLRYRFPDKTNNKKKRRYLPVRIHSLEQIEKEMGIDSDLTQIRKKINKKYSPYLADELKAKQESGPLFHKGKVKEDLEDKKRIRLEK
jgi:hypothetical protein